MKNKIKCYTVLMFLIASSFQTKPSPQKELLTVHMPKLEKFPQLLITEFDENINTIHIMVALCDNQYQGIVPVPKKLGNGQDPKNNLYWGALYGVKSHFKKSEEWVLQESRQPSSILLERLVFKHHKNNYFIVADAYDGKYIKQTTQKFLQSSAGLEKDTLKIGDTTLGIEGNAKLVAYVGHDGLMDFQINEQLKNEDGLERDVIILACYSKNYFKPQLANANVNPLVWTTGLMAPEAYTLHDALSGYVEGESNAQIQLRAANAYSEYQGCSLKAAGNLLVTE